MVTKEELEKLKRPELCDYCRKHNIPGYSGKTKAERIKLILDFYKKPKFERPLPRKPKEMDRKQLKRYVKKEVSEGRQATLVKSKKKVSTFKEIKLWHSTTIDRIPSILKRGLIAGYKEPAGQEWLPEYHGKGTYFHTRYPDHEIYNGIIDGEVFLGVIEVKINADLDKIISEEEGVSGLKGLKALEEGGGVVYLEKRISPYSIEKIYLPYDGDDKTIYKTFNDNPELKNYSHKIIWKEVK